MKHDSYRSLSITEDYGIFDFYSTGPNGIILKRIKFSPTTYRGVYNLTFGDVDNHGEINDYVISNNQDRNKLLATIAYVIEVYLNAHPTRWIYFTGSTDERTRLYRMAIGLNLDELQTKFHIYSKVGEDFIQFQRNMNIEGILIRIKS